MEAGKAKRQNSRWKKEEGAEGSASDERKAFAVKFPVLPCEANEAEAILLRCRR